MQRSPWDLRRCSWRWHNQSWGRPAESGAWHDVGHLNGKQAVILLFIYFFLTWVQTKIQYIKRQSAEWKQEEMCVVRDQSPLMTNFFGFDLKINEMEFFFSFKSRVKITLETRRIVSEILSSRSNEDVERVQARQRLLAFMSQRVFFPFL